MKNIKTRVLPDSNYRAVYFNGKTMRFHIDGKKPVTELTYPEFYDVKITGKCFGNCKDYCYQSSKCVDVDYDTKSFLNYMDSLSENDRPFQIAIGGGEPTLHKDFVKFLKQVKELSISPNYTTNGMWVKTKSKDKIIEATKKYCEGVAVSCHQHLKEYWEEAANTLIENEVFTNFHHIISDRKSVDSFVEIHKSWRGKIKYFVVLPLIEKGMSKKGMTAFSYFFSEVKKLKDVNGSINDIAFGANFYSYLKDKDWIKIDLYEPEMMSKYIDLKDGKVYRSSFSTEEVVGSIKKGFKYDSLLPN